MSPSGFFLRFITHYFDMYRVVLDHFLSLWTLLYVSRRFWTCLEAFGDFWRLAIITVKPVIEGGSSV